jgi:hypothetical protein
MQKKVIERGVNMERVFTVIWATKGVREKYSFSREPLKDNLDYQEGLIEPFNLFGHPDPTPAEADKLMQISPKYQ